ncbi:ATP-grasp domain-containing protein [Salinicoccus halitifaciens]|uniref:D-alanine-D-alanine ligase-like ATP-grasp enzyme n=1 Tax=Salinicoccus halitifaciens TaxID=1073415 RepID=A0ABV2EBZ6_9STAP|nr:ATP-grasp domain-containing protein [Salinicoccus halitifaciens]MCD2137393.1 ATP-grasp domain-containing protein [Salinicoccus halitifaciens]
MNQKKFFNDYSAIQKQLPAQAKGLPLITYSITLEAWRRGIEVSFFSAAAKNRQSTYYTLKNAGIEYNFRLSFGGLMEKAARKIVNDKAETKKYLKAADISVPEGRSIQLNNNLEEIVEYAASIGFPVVAKPLDARNATGVFTDLKNREALEGALKILREDLNCGEVIVEQYVKGEDTRVYVIEDEVIAAYIRRPANVIGDGRKNIEELIKEKNEIRQNNPHLKKFNIEIDDKLLSYLKDNSLSLTSVPEDGERVYLSKSTLHPDGCETVDVTDELSDKMKALAVEALKAIPGMKVSGIDIIVDRSEDKGYILELNGAPNICGHIYPMEGEPKDVPKALIDYHFPETADKTVDNHEYFTFDLDTVSKTLKSGAVKRVTLPALPEGKLASMKIAVSGYTEKNISDIHRTAVRLQLGGKIIRKANKKLIVKVAGKKDKVKEFSKIILRKIGPGAEVIEENRWYGAYPYYFKAPSIDKSKETSQAMKLRSENIKLKESVSKLKDIEKENQRLLKEIDELKSSRSWKVTKPLRSVKSRLIN